VTAVTQWILSPKGGQWGSRTHGPRAPHSAVIVLQFRVKSVLLYFKCVFSLVHCTRVECKCTGFAEYCTLSACQVLCTVLKKRVRYCTVCGPGEQRVRKRRALTHHRQAGGLWRHDGARGVAEGEGISLCVQRPGGGRGNYPLCVDPSTEPAKTRRYHLHAGGLRLGVLEK
jgi:hypothetical protein